jgi:hypothetical protein
VIRPLAAGLAAALLASDHPLDGVERRVANGIGLFAAPASAADVP